MNKGLGLRFAPDMRNSLFRLGDYLRDQYAGRALPDERVWAHGDILDQGREGTCVGHGWTAWYNSKPRGFQVQQDHDYALEWYDRATELDGFPGNEGDRQSGTTTLAGVRVALERELAQSYVWAATFDEVSAFIRAEGPVVWGTNWYNSMFEPDANGFINVRPASGLAGGHEWLMFGVHLDGTTDAQNSWGPEWGDEGTMHFSRAAIDALMRRAGEACACVQTAVEPR